MSNKRLHYNRLQDALKSRKLIILQYSSTDISKPPIQITSVFGIDYFKDQEWCVLGNDQEFRKKVKDYLNRHKDYYFLIWNFNIDYSFQNFDLGFSQKKLDEINERCIDFDDVLEVYSEIKDTGYIKKVKGGFDSRYYLALLNKIRMTSDWLWGGAEKDIRDYQILKRSSRLKAKVMTNLLERFEKSTLRVEHNDKIVEKSKEIIKPFKAKEKSNRYNQSPHFENVKSDKININYGNQNNTIVDSSVRYKGEKQNLIFLEITAPRLIGKFGEKRIGIVGAVSLLVGFIQLAIWINSAFSSYDLSYLPSVSEAASKWFLGGGMIFFILGVFLLAVIAYYHDSRCKKCGKFYAYQEIDNPDVREVNAHDGIHITTKRKWRCKYCGHIDITKQTQTKEHPSKSAF